MAEEAHAERADGGAEAAGGGGRKKLVVLVAAVLLLLGGGGGVAWKLGFLGAKAKHAEAKDLGAEPANAAAGGEHGGAAASGAAGAGMGALVPLDPFIANLSDEDGRRYLKATLSVEFFRPAAPPEFTQRLPQVRDLMLTLFSSKTFAEVRTPQGKAVLRDEIVTRLNHALRTDAVKAVYFTEFIVQ
ncbi:MAG: flagellar basal body-associated FliL family protein [bacterium]|nr:flagellar basal body-associated FliL family protein [bacterium]